MLRRFFLTGCLLAGAVLTACTNPNDLDEPMVDLGDFSLGHNIVVAPNFQKGPLSRDMSDERWIEALTGRIAERFDRYEGDKLYHFGISLEGYVLAQPGIPLVASPKSMLIIRVTVWDDAAGKKLNDKAYQMIVFESLSGEQVIGSGLTQDAETQLDNLTKNASKMLETWLLKQMREKGWFVPSAEAATPMSKNEGEAE